MFFTIIDHFAEIPANPQRVAFLLTDNWDDWFSFRTTFTLWVFDEQGVRHRVGSVKIGQHGLLPAPASNDVPPNSRFPNLARTFNRLEPGFFSLRGIGEFVTY